jgi:hypothetical protein
MRRPVRHAADPKVVIRCDRCGREIELAEDGAKLDDAQAFLAQHHDCLIVLPDRPESRPRGADPER